MKKTLSLFTVGIIWLASMVWFGHKQAGCSRELPSIKTEKAKSNEIWHGIYFSGEKVGYSLTFSQALEDGGRQVNNRSYMKINMMDTPQEVKTFVKYRLDKNYLLKDFNFIIDGAARMDILGKVEDKNLELEISSGAQKQRQSIKLEGPVYLPDAIEPMIANKSIARGGKYRYSTFDPASLSLQPAVIEIQGQETLKVNNDVYLATKLTLETSGITSTVWVDTLGNTIKEEGPLGITLIRQTREQAIDLPGKIEGLDLLTRLSVPSSGAVLPAPRNVGFMKIRLSGVNIKMLDINGGRQVMTDSTGMTVVIRRETPDNSDGKPPSDIKEYLKPTPLIQTEDKNIKQTARLVTAGAKTEWGKAAAISRWVYENLEKKMTISLPSAVEVLKSKRGDCNEHSTLYAALARAAGIPTKLCLGVVYMDGRFYYHAWNAVYCGKWIELDATFGQTPADAAHLRLIEGDLSRQNKLLPVMGNLQIEILEYK